MKSLQKFTWMMVVLSMVMTGFVNIPETGKNGKGDKEENIKTLYNEVEKAVDTRHFDSAKEAINKMLPLMKKDLKEGKKHLSSWDKISTNSSLKKEDFAAQLSKKNKIYISTKSLISSSPAAIRVKGKQMVEMLNEYISLVNQ